MSPLDGEGCPVAHQHAKLTGLTRARWGFAITPIKHGRLLFLTGRKAECGKKDQHEEEGADAVHGAKLEAGWQSVNAARQLIFRVCPGHAD